jgi:hypothetical protein
MNYPAPGSGISVRGGSSPLPLWRTHAHHLPYYGSPRWPRIAFAQQDRNVYKTHGIHSVLRIYFEKEYAGM